MLDKIAEKARELNFGVDEYTLQGNLHNIVIKVSFLQLAVYDDLTIYFVSTYSDYKLSNEDIYYMEKLGKLMYFIRELRIDKLLKQ